MLQWIVYLLRGFLHQQALVHLGSGLVVVVASNAPIQLVIANINPGSFLGFSFGSFLIFLILPLVAQLRRPWMIPPLPHLALIRTSSATQLVGLLHILVSSSNSNSSSTSSHFLLWLRCMDVYIVTFLSLRTFGRRGHQRLI